ncbi:MAG: hypothetical protein SCH98_11680 [Deferrisomatales bacterium]|nr:hypothetical protein [Deferrisomatales bacterium]
MDLVARLGHGVAGGAGFFAGFLWGVSHWVGTGGVAREELLRAALVPGGCLAVGYAVAGALVFWSFLPSPCVVGMRAIVAPAAFTLSLGAGFLGLRGALWLLGS